MSAVAPWWRRRSPETTPPASVRRSATSKDCSSGVQIAANLGRGIYTGTLTDADKEDIAAYLFDQMRKGGFLPEVDPGTTPQQLALQERKARILLAETIRTLPEREDVVYTLRYDEGMSISDIADLLGVSTSTICRFHRSAVLLLAEKVGTAFDTH